MSVDETVAYGRHAFCSMLRHADLDATDLEGQRWLEIGPGDSQALGLFALANGAREVVGLERFAVRRDPARTQAIRDAIGASDAITLVEGFGIEDAADHFGPGKLRRDLLGRGAGARR